MLAFSHRFTFGLCVSVIVLTASVVASVALMYHKQQDNALLLQHVNSLKTENATLRRQLRRLTATQPDTQQQGLARPADMESAPAAGGLASDS